MKAEATVELIKTELTWEGAELHKSPFLRAEIANRVNQLRDPNIFKDEDGKLYLLYAGGGEQVIRITSLEIMN